MGVAGVALSQWEFLNNQTKAPAMKDEDLRVALMVVQCDLHINQILLSELIAQAPDPELLLRRFQQAIEAMTQNAPADIDLEHLVELRARAAQTELIARHTLTASSASRQSPP